MCVWEGGSVCVGGCVESRVCVKKNYANGDIQKETYNMFTSWQPNELSASATPSGGKKYNYRHF